MSRPDRPFRSTHVMGVRTVHYDYATKEERARSGSSEISLGYHFTTVTSRKPLKPGTPVCWVNVFAESHRPSAHTTKVLADQYGQDRLHCIPVYLPVEGAERRSGSGPLVPLEEHNREVNTARAEVERLTNLAKDWETTARVRAEERDAALTEVAQLKAAADRRETQLTSALDAAAAHKAEVERLTKERDAALAQRDAAESALASAHESLADTHRLRVDLAEAQAQAMPAGKVVYGARCTGPVFFGMKVECESEHERAHHFPKHHGWTWFTRVEES